MNSQTLTNLGVIVTIFVGLIGVFFLARNSQRETARQVEQAKERAITEAVQPLRDQLTGANQTILRRDRTIERLEARVDSLEDELRRGRGRDRNGQD